MLLNDGENAGRRIREIEDTLQGVYGEKYDDDPDIDMQITNELAREDKN